MKKFFMLLGSLVMFTSLSHAVDRSKTMSVSDFTGDQVEMVRVGVSSTSATALSAYSSSRGALTCLNTDLTYSVWLGSTTAFTAGGISSFPLPALSSIQFRSNASIFGLASVGVSSSTVHCIREY